MNPAMMGSHEQKMMNSTSCYNVNNSFILGYLKRSPDFKTAVTSCKRRALIIEDEFKNTYFC